MATTLLLIRHGETAWNAARRIQGQLDEPLSEVGLEQARRLTAYLADVQLDAVIASDLARARQTAAALAESRGLPLELDARLRERHFGIFEGRFYDDLEREQSPEWIAYRRSDPDWAIPAGESLNQLSARVFAVMTQLAIERDGGTLAVVTHGGALDAIYRRARYLTWSVPRDFALGNASINRVRAKALPLDLEILSWGEASHLVEPVQTMQSP